MTRAEMRIRVLQAIFHPTRSNDQIVEFVKEFEKKLFADIVFEGEEPEEAPAPVQKKRA